MRIATSPYFAKHQPLLHQTWQQPSDARLQLVGKEAMEFFVMQWCLQMFPNASMKQLSLIKALYVNATRLNHVCAKHWCNKHASDAHDHLSMMRTIGLLLQIDPSRTGAFVQEYILAEERPHTIITHLQQHMSHHANTTISLLYNIIAITSASMNAIANTKHAHEPRQHVSHIALHGSGAAAYECQYWMPTLMHSRSDLLGAARAYTKVDAQHMAASNALIHLFSKIYNF